MVKRKPAKSKFTKFAQATKKFKGKKLGNLRDQKKKPRVDPLWTLDDGVTYSLLSSFLNCRERFHIANVQGWKPKKFNFPLEFGNIIHLLIEAQDMGIPNDLITNITTNYVKEKINSNNFNEETIKELSMMAAVAAVTFKHYVAFWEQNACFFIDDRWYYEKDFHWLAKEENFDVDYTMPNGRKIKLRGKRDGRFKIGRRIKGYWIYETKTKGNIDPAGITAGLHKDMQTGMYSVASQIEQNGIAPEGVLYNVIRRTGMKPRVGDSPQSFAERVEEDMLKKPEHYFMRWTRKISKDELNDFKRRQLNPTLHQIVTWWDSIKNNPMRPFETTCDGCYRTKSTEKCRLCKGTGVIDNLNHFERAFGHYDAMSFSQRGEFFEIITDNNYFLYEQKQHTFPELDSEEKISDYLPEPNHI